MAFDYQTLKNYTNDSLIDNTLLQSNIGTDQIVNANLIDDSITANKFADNAVVNSNSKTTGTLPTSKGGTGLTSLGGAFKAIRSTGSSLDYHEHGLRSMSVFTGNGTWTRPANVRYIKVQVQGGGGGGSGHGEGGGAGGYAERYLDVTGISSVGVTVGGGGGGTYYSNQGGNGAGSSFRPYVSASAGHGANRQNQHSGGVSGNGSGGNLNLHSGGGFNHHARSAQSCANTFFGGGAPGNHPQGGHFAHRHQGYSAPGTGGAGAHFNGHRGSDGRPGIIIITEYY